MDDEILKEPEKLELEDKLFLDRFKVGKKSHLRLKDKEICRKCKDKACVYACPVQNYKKVDGVVELSWEGCLECGSCRIVCKHGVIEWNYPQGGFGITYRYG